MTTSEPTAPDAVYRSPRQPSGLSMDDFAYDLPGSAIAQTPIEPRDSARLLDATSTDADGSGIVHRHVHDLPDLLRAGDVLVLNETRVIPARIKLQKPTGGAVEVLLVDRTPDGAWKALVRPSKRVPAGTRLAAGDDLTVEIGDVLDGGQRRVRLLGSDPSGAAGAFRELSDGETELALERHGEAPLPPYITATLGDSSRYQTVYARTPGSAAAPTAGLHFTPDVLERCRAKGVSVHTVDLCVGLDTFRPVTVERPEDHDIHSERYRVAPETLDACRAARAAGGRVIAVGTTSVRALESAAASGAPEGRTALFIYGEYDFRLVDVLMTNFHMPRTSLLLLVDSFAGPKWRVVYREALAAGYRFLSFGDATLFARQVV
jgi:S-adenosylmethionine:tRNA ribosyltransferase-isomerase